MMIEFVLWELKSAIWSEALEKSEQHQYNAFEKVSVSLPYPFNEACVTPVSQAHQVAKLKVG